MSEMNDAVEMMSTLDENWRRLSKMKTLTVPTLNVSEMIRSFHVQRNWKMASEAIAGRPSGRIRRRKIQIAFAPSIRADSRMAFGIPMKKLRRRKTAKGSRNAAWERITLRTVPTMPGGL